MILLIIVVAVALGVFLDIARKEWRNYSGCGCSRSGARRNKTDKTDRTNA